MGFLFNGTTSQSIGITARVVHSNKIPSVRNNTDTLSGKHGILDFGATVAERKIDLSCCIFPQKSEEEFLAIEDKVSEWLNPDKGLCELVLDDEPDRKYMARLMEGVSIEKGIMHTGTFDLKFFCPDPFGYAIDDDEFSLTSSTDIKRTKGNVDSQPLYKITGELADSAASIAFSVNGETVRLYGPLAVGETFEMDTENMTAKITDASGTERNALGQLESLNFPYMVKGSNQITVGVEEGTLTALVVVARSRWL